MKTQIKIFLLLFFCLISIRFTAQNKKPAVVIAYDYFYDITFEKHQLVLTDSGIEILNTIGDLITKHKSDQEYHFDIVPSIEEFKNSNHIGFLRVAIILNFLKDRFKVDKSKLTFTFHEAIPIEGTIRFSIR